MNTVIPFSPARPDKAASSRGNRSTKRGDVLALPNVDLETVMEMMACFRDLEERGILQTVDHTTPQPQHLGSETLAQSH